MVRTLERTYQQHFIDQLLPVRPAVRQDRPQAGQDRPAARGDRPPAGQDRGPRRQERRMYNLRQTTQRQHQYRYTN